MSDRASTSEYAPPSGVEIGRRQNDPTALRLLIAQRRLYSRAKRWQAVRWVGLVVLGVGAPFVALLIPGAAIAAGALTGVWLFVGRTALSAVETRTMVRAACVQEAVDHYVFAMPTTIRRSAAPTPEEIELLVGGDDVRRVAEQERLIDWYPVDAEADGATVVAIAQRANASYTDRLIRTTVTVWAAAAVTWLTVLVVWACLAQVLLTDFLLGALFPVLPAFLDISEYVTNTWKAAHDRADLARTIADRLSGSDPDVDGADLLVWQERLFDLRRTTPQVPDWLYWLTRRRNERAMYAAARQLGS